MVRAAPSAADLALLDPEGMFRSRLEADRVTLLTQAGDLASLRLVAHQLSGAAGTFGFSELGGIAMAIDDRFAEGRPVTARHIEDLLAALDSAIEKSA
jgi:HPt (histidine-containing phosphotransfer) domain-containing protein